MVTLHFKNKIYNTPTEWNELTKKKFLGIVRVLNSPADEMKGRLMLLKVLTGMSWWKFFRIKDKEFLPLLELTDFVIKKNRLTRQLIPFFCGSYGPEGNLNNLKMQEFVFSEMYLSAYQSEKEEKYLNLLLAVLYRPAKKDYNKRQNPEGDIRKEFNPNITEWLAKKTAKWPLYIKQAILLWYTGCRNEWINTFSNVFGGGDEGEGSKYGMYSIIRSVAKDGVFGQFENVEKQYVTTVLMHLDESVSEAQKLKKAYKK